MAEWDLSDDSRVGILVRTRMEQYEQAHSGCSVYVSDQRGMWDLRFTCGKGKEKKGTAYISAPDALGWMVQLRWPAGGKADIQRLQFENTAGLEGFLLSALSFEEKGS